MSIFFGSAEPTAEADEHYLPIPLESLRLDTVTGFDLYLHHPGNNRFILYRQGDLNFTEEHRSKLLDSGVTRLHIRAADRTAYLDYIEENLEEITTDPGVTHEQSSELVYGIALHAVEEIFRRPGVAPALERSGNIVRAAIGHLLRGPGSLACLLDKMAADYGLYTHAVNVSVLGLALGARVGLDDGELHHLGAGLLLHDIGKTRIAPEILDSTEPLMQDEERELQRHPELGAELLRGNQDLDSSTLAVVLQHHERCTGKGYPRGLAGEAIHPFARIASLVNAFDGLTTNRPFRRAFLSYPAIRLMQEIRGQDFDPVLFREMILMLADGEQQPARNLTDDLLDDGEDRRAA